MYRAACLVALSLLASPLWAQVDLTRPFSPDSQTVQLLHLDDVASGRCADAMGGPAGKLTGGKPSLGRFGGGLSFDGTTGWADFVRPAGAPAPERALTVECWVKFRNRAQGDIICRNGAYMMRIGGGVEALIGIDGQWRHVAGSRPVPVGRWVHLAMTYDQADKMVRIYIDGRLDVARKPEGITAGKLDAGSSTLRLGTNDWNPAGGEMDGILDEVRISSVARTYTPLPRPGRPPVPEGVNLLLNPGFELGTHGWRPDGEADANLQWEVVAGKAPEGRHLLRSREQGGYGLLSYPVAIVPGKTHTLSAYLRADRDASTTISLTSAGLARGAKLVGHRERVRLTTRWQRVSLKYDIPLGFPSDHVYARIDKPAGVRLDLDDVCLVVGDDKEPAPGPADLFGARLKVLPSLCKLHPGRAKLPAVVFNYSAATRQVEVRYRLTDWRGEQVASGRVFSGKLAPGEVPATWAMPTGRVGWYTLTIDTSVDGKLASSVPYVANVIDDLADTKPGKAALASPLGMNTHMAREPSEDLRENLATLARCGVKWIRAWWGWGMAEKQPGHFDWTEFDRQYNAVHAAGMEIMPILLRYYPQYEQAWAGKMDRIQEPPYDLQQWGNFVEATVKRYRGRVHAWEVWNEPVYTMDAKTYAGILKMTYARVKAADPQALVVGFAGVPLDYIRDAFADGAAHSLDVLSHHSYSELVQPFVAEAKLQSETLAVMKQAGVDVPVWHTEQGSGADGAGYLGMAASEEACAVNLVQSYLSTLATGVRKFFWFSAQTSPTYGWGVYYENYIPRPRLVALNGLARLLQGRQVEARLPLMDGRVAAVLLDGTAGPAAAVWNLRDPLSLTMPGRGLQLADMFCNPLPASAGDINLRLQGGRPIYVLAKGLTLEELRQRLQAAVEGPRELPFRVTLSPAGPGKLKLVVRNTGDAALDVDLRLMAPPALAQERTVEIRDLAPRATWSQSLVLDHNPAAGQSLAVRIAVSLGGEELRHETLTRQVRW